MACTVPDAGPLGASRELRRSDPASYCDLFTDPRP